MATTTTFVIHGVHISENLLHHKQSDVRRILEDKGFCEQPERSDAESLHFGPESGSATGDAQTTIRFDAEGFVLEEDGVAHS